MRYSKSGSGKPPQKNAYQTSPGSFEHLVTVYDLRGTFLS